MKTAKKGRPEGFSLIEMIIAIAIVGLVMSGVVLLISYSTNNMRRTSNSVQLQDEAKDAVIHITTYLQESSDATWNSEKKALIIAKRIKKEKRGKPYDFKLEVSHYWFVPDEKLRDDQKGLVFAKDVVDFICQVNDNQYIGDDPKIGIVPTMADDAVPTGVICFCKRVYSDYNGFITSDGDIDFSKLGLKYDLITDAKAEMTDFMEDLDVISVGAPPIISGDIPDPTPKPQILKIGGKSVVVSIQMKNENGDASFVSTKEVYLRNK